MSVQKNTYMIIGAKWDYDEFYELPEIKKDMNEDLDLGWEKEEKYWDSAFDGIFHHNGLCVISDGTDGEYVYIGYVLKKSGNYGDINDYKSDEKPTEEEIERRIMSEFGIDAKCEIHVFTHYR